MTIADFLAQLIAFLVVVSVAGIFFISWLNRRHTRDLERVYRNDYDPHNVFEKATLERRSAVANSDRTSRKTNRASSRACKACSASRAQK